MSTLTIEPLLTLQDNYTYFLRDSATGATAVIDPGEASPVLRAVDKAQWKVQWILNTHHHYDHVGGNLEIQKQTGCTIVGSRIDASRIPGIDQLVGEGDTVKVGAVSITILEIPGHTRGHVALWLREHQAVFTGDTLFGLGCGRLFEGTAQEMWTSLKKLRDLPDETRVYCGHEYAQANARFALTVDPANLALQKRMTRIQDKRSQGQPSVPSTLEEERATNPFLRADDPAFQQALGIQGQDPVHVFAEVRRRKDRF